MIGMFTLLLVENLGDPAPLRDRLAKRYDMVRGQYAESIRAGQTAGVIRADLDPDLKSVEVSPSSTGWKRRVS